MRSVPDFSFEFFPPRSAEGKAKLRATWQELAKLKPRFFSCTYGAGGSTREGTLDTVLEIIGGGHEAAPHISCVASTRQDIAAQLERYKAAGIRHLVALRGDLPSGIAASGEFRYASELVAFIRQATGDWFRIEVACYPEYHPQTRSAADEVKNFRKKVDAGANAAITQYFYNADAYFRFVDECRAAGLTLPIVPGVMPIGNFSQLARFSDACGAEIPRWMRVKLEGYRDDAASIRAFGLDVVTDLCAKLLAAGAPGLHFYTLNQAGLSTEIWRRLGL
jgi:methylenetetrahydrofolate reductase (NADH)